MAAATTQEQQEHPRTTTTTGALTTTNANKSHEKCPSTGAGHEDGVSGVD